MITRLRTRRFYDWLGSDTSLPFAEWCAEQDRLGGLAARWWPAGALLVFIAGVVVGTVAIVIAAVRR